MSFPVKRSQKLPRNLPIRVKKPVGYQCGEFDFRFFENFGNQKKLNLKRKSLKSKTKDTRILIEVSGNIYETHESTLNQFPGYFETNTLRRFSF